MGCGEKKESIESQMLMLRLERDEIKKEREKLAIHYRSLSGHTLRIKKIPDYLWSPECEPKQKKKKKKKRRIINPPTPMIESESETPLATEEREEEEAEDALNALRERMKKMKEESKNKDNNENKENKNNINDNKNNDIFNSNNNDTEQLTTKVDDERKETKKITVKKLNLQDIDNNIESDSNREERKTTRIITVKSTKNYDSDSNRNEERRFNYA